MKRIALITFFGIFLISFNIQSVWAGEVDILIDKLVEKKLLSESEAKELINEIQKEADREKAEIQQVAADAAKEEAKASMIKLPKWVEKINLGGDLRLRHDTQWRTERALGATSDTEYHRNRERFRLRLGMNAKTSENTEVGIRLVSGSGFQNTTNQSFDEHARGKNIFIDRAYASWKVTDWLNIQGGKHQNPLFTSPLVWDPDVNPEGISESLKFDITDRINIFANFGQWLIEELNVQDTNSDSTLLAYQVGSSIKPTEKTKLEIGLTYYDFRDLDELKWSAGVLDDTTEFLGYNDGHYQQMIFDNGGKLLNEFGCWELGAKLEIKDVIPVPFSIFGNFINNERADINDLIMKGVNPGDSNPANLARYSGDDRESGWQLGMSLGNSKKKGDWYAKYFYQVLEDYAFPAVFVDSDFHNGGTNNKGHYIQGRYHFTDNIQARATGYFTERDDERKDGKRDEDRIQLDVIFKF